MPLRDLTTCRAGRAVSLGLPPSATSPALTAVDSRREHARFRVRLAGAGFARHRLRTSLSCTVHSTVTAPARASGSVLPTTAFTTSRTVRHSIAVAAPLRELRPRRFPFAHTPGLPLLTACRGFGFHTRRIPMQVAEKA